MVTPLTLSHTSHMKVKTNDAWHNHWLCMRYASGPTASLASCNAIGTWQPAGCYARHHILCLWVEPVANDMADSTPILRCSQCHWPAAGMLMPRYRWADVESTAPAAGTAVLASGQSPCTEPCANSTARPARPYSSTGLLSKTHGAIDSAQHSVLC
jgi:hypothetical protein